MWAALTVTERGGSHGSQRPIHLPRAVLSLSPLAVRFRIVGDPAGTVVSIYYEDVASIAVLPELGQLVIGTGEPELLTGGREYIVSVRDAALSRQLGDVIEFKAVEHRAMRHERRDRQLWRSATMQLPKPDNGPHVSSALSSSSAAFVSPVLRSGDRAHLNSTIVRPALVESPPRNTVRGDDVIRTLPFEAKSGPLAVRRVVKEPAPRWADAPPDVVAAGPASTVAVPATYGDRGVYREASASAGSAAGDASRARIRPMSIPTAGATPFGTGAHGELLAPRRAQHTENVLAIHAPPPPPWLVSRKPSELERHDAQLHEPQPQHANVGSPPPIPGPSPQRVPAASRSNPLSAGWPTSAPLAQTYGKPKPFVFDQPPPFMFPKGSAPRRPAGDSLLLHVPMLLPHSGPGTTQRLGEGTSAIHSPEARTPPPPPPAAEAPGSRSARQSAAPTSPPPPPSAGASPGTNRSAQEDSRVEAPADGGSLQRQTTAVTASGQPTEPAQRPRGPTSRPTSFHQQPQQQHSPAAAEPPIDGSRAAAAPARTSTFRPKTAPRPRTEATGAPPAGPGLDSQPGSFTSAASFTTGPSSPSFYNGPSNQQQQAPPRAAETAPRAVGPAAAAQASPSASTASGGRPPPPSGYGPKKRPADPTAQRHPPPVAEL
jgi:hypothetical protein